VSVPQDLVIISSDGTFDAVELEDFQPTSCSTTSITGSTHLPLHTLLEEAAEGRLPAWSQVTRPRRDHVTRVADLMGEWATRLGHDTSEVRRWRAAGFLHDALRDAEPHALRPLVPDTFRHLTGKLLHGPAAAEKLRQDGIADESLLCAVAYHTIGHASLDELGRCLFIADYIEPGRKYEPARLASLRARMPADRQAVLIEVLRSRMERLLGEGRGIRAETATFWQSIGGPSAGAQNAGSN
jgi:HD superfamily phosphohydrolase YqeK